MSKINYLAPVLLFAACADDGSATGATGRVQVFVEAEETVPEGLEPGSGDENIVDGWRVTYTRFLIGIGNFRAGRSADSGAALTEPAHFVVDLLQLPAGGLVVADFAGVAAERWDRFGYDLSRVTSKSIAAEGITDDSVALMVDNGYSLYFEAELTKSDGQSCTPGKTAECVAAPKITVAWGLDASTAFDDCAPPEGDAGFAVPAGGTVQVKPTIHGDHWFFSNITQGAEITVRRAQWIVDCDTNRDGTTTLDELKAVQASDVFPPALFNLSGGGTIASAYDFLLAQARTLGDFNGEGECPTRAAIP